MREWLYHFVGICLLFIGCFAFADGEQRLGNNIVGYIVGVFLIAHGGYLILISNLPKPPRRPTVFPEEPKTTCVSCGAQILQTTADRTDGYCMPCFQRAPTEERKVDPWSLPSRCSKRGFDPANRETFLDLCNLIAPEDSNLKERVCHSIDDADQFAISNRKYLGQVTYWLPFDVIVDWMEEHDMLIGVDHNCEFEDIAWAVNKLMHT